MTRKIRVALFGAAGCVASVCIQTLVERGAEIVAGFEIRDIGKDIGEAAGLSAPLGVALTDVKDFERVLDETKPDIALDCSLNLLSEVYPHARGCMERGVNYMPVGICCYYPFLTDPDLAKMLDEIGQRTGATYLGSGSGEVWQSLPLVVSGLSGSVKRVKLVFNALLNEFGEGSYEGMGFATPPDEWGPYLEVNEPSPWEHVDRLLAVKMGLHITRVEQHSGAEAAPEDMHPVAGSDFVIPKGYLSGYSDQTIVHTQEGIDIESISYFKFGMPGETNSFTCEITGEPNLKMVIEDFHGEVTTSIIMINRIPDLLHAPGGIMMVNDLPMISYKSAGEFEIDPDFYGHPDHEVGRK